MLRTACFFFGLRITILSLDIHIAIRILRILPAADVMIGEEFPEIVATTLLQLVVIHSTVLCVVTGLELMIILSLAVVTQLFGSGTTLVCSMLGKLVAGVVSDVVLTVNVEDEDDKIVALWLDKAIVMN